MKCTLSLNAKNGEKSILFKKLVEATNNVEEAIDKYYYIQTDEFKDAYGNWSAKGFDKTKLDPNGEPVYESIGSKYLDEIEYAKVELNTRAETYKNMMRDIPFILSKLDKNIQTLKKMGKNPELLAKLEEIRPLLANGDITEGIPKFIENSRNHLVSLEKRIKKETDIKKIQSIYKNASNYEVIKSLNATLFQDKNIRKLFEGTSLEQAGDVISILTNIEAIHFTKSKLFLVEELHKRNPSWSKADINKLFNEAPRDAKNTEYWLEYIGDSQDKVLASVATMVKDQENAIRRERIKFTQELSEMTDTLLKNSPSKKPEEVFADIIYERNNEYHVLDINAKFTDGKDIGSDLMFKKVEAVRRNNPELYKYLLFFSDAMDKLDASLPKYARNGTRLPSVLKPTRERLEGKSMKEKYDLISDEISKTIIRSNDDLGRGQIEDSTGQPINTIPILYQQKYDTADFNSFFETKKKELIKAGKSEGDADTEARQYALTEATKKFKEVISLDLSHSLLSYHAMAVNYAKKNEIITTLEAARAVVGSENRRYVKLDAAGKPVKEKNEFGEDTPTYLYGKQSNAYKSLDTFMSMHVYGQKELELGTWNIGGKKIDSNKAYRAINKFTSFLQMGLNFFGSTANIIVGEYNNALEVFGGEYTNKKSYDKAGKLYRENIGNLLKDIGSRTPSSIINQLSEHYGFLGDYSPNMKVNENSKFRRLFKTNLMFFMQGSGEHFVQNRLALSVLDNIKAYDKNGNEIGTLLDQHSPGKGVVNIATTYVKNANGELVLYDEAQQNIVSNKITTVLRKVHGNYSSSTATKAKQDARTALILKYRDWVYEGLTRRFGSAQENLALNDTVEGFYRGGGKELLKLASHIKTFQFQLMKEDWQRLTPKERAHIKKMVAEVSTIVLLMISSAMLGKMGDLVEEEYEDEEDFKSRLALGSFNFLAYQVNRVHTEVAAYVNPIEAIRIMSSPAASTNVLNDIAKLVYEVGKFHPLKEREGGRRDGELELWIKASKLIPMYKNVSRFSPEGIEEAGIFYKF